jgi:hypothetical protein
MQGQLIVVKDVNGNALIRRVWDITDYGAFIHSEEEFSKRMRGEKTLDPVGFPACDAFKYDDVAKAQIGETVLNWEKLTPLLALSRQP